MRETYRDQVRSTIQTGQNINHVFLNRSIINELRTEERTHARVPSLLRCTQRVYTEIKDLSSKKNIERAQEIYSSYNELQTHLSYLDLTSKTSCLVAISPSDDDLLYFQNE